MPRRLARAAAVSCLVLAPTGPAAARPDAGTPTAGVYAGSYALPAGMRLADVAVELRRRGAGWRAIVSLQHGHAARVDVAAQVAGGRVRFALPGRPAPLVFRGRIEGRVLSGRVDQGAAHGTVHATRRASWTAAGLDRLVGTYALASGRRVAVSAYGRVPRLLDAGTGAWRRLTRTSGTTYAIGAGVDRPAPTAGTARFAADGSSVVVRSASGQDRGVREAARQLEVRFPGATATLAGTLTLPPGPGPHPAVVWVHGSGPSLRDEPLNWAARLVGEGVAVLAYDKRGVGQSLGVYPGELATGTSLGAYARDAEAALRFLAAQREIDRRRIGLMGVSQGGWIAPLAASRSPLARFAVLLSGPTITVGEQHAYAELTGAGASEPPFGPDEISRRLAAEGPSGYDPAPSIRRLTIPALWLYGAVDPVVPARESVAILDRLRAERAHDFTRLVFPGANHFLLVDPSGLQRDVARSPGYAPGLLDSLAAWLRARLAPR